MLRGSVSLNEADRELTNKSRYCAMASNATPYVKEIAPELFKPLITTIPSIRTLVWLVALNGQVVRKFHAKPCTIEEVCHLESISGKVFSSIARTRPDKWHDIVDVELQMEILLQINTFW